MESSVIQVKEDTSNAQLNLTALLTHRGISIPHETGIFYSPILKPKLISHFTIIPPISIHFSLILMTNTVTPNKYTREPTFEPEKLFYVIPSLPFSIGKTRKKEKVIPVLSVLSEKNKTLYERQRT